MDSTQLNKIAMAVLGTVFAVFGLSIVSEAIFHSSHPAEPAYILAEVDESGGGEGAQPAGPAYEPVSPLLASADIDAGEAVFKKCASCHTLEQGGANKVGPNLWGAVGRDIATAPDFSYSAALVEFGQGKQWSYEELNGFFYKPKSYVKGTAMGFVGLKDVQDRADVIAYLREYSDSPPPLPQAVEKVATDGNVDEQAPSSADATGDDPASESESSDMPANDADAPASDETSPSEEESDTSH